MLHSHRKAAGHIIDKHALIQQTLHEVRLSKVVALVGDIEGASQEGVSWHERHERAPSRAKNTVQFSGGAIPVVWIGEMVERSQTQDCVK